MIEVVVCDLGGVLTTPLAEGFAVVREHLGIPVAALNTGMQMIAAARGGELPLHALERGELSEPEFFTQLGDALTQTLGRPVDLSDFSQVYWSALGANPLMIDELHALKGRGYRLALLTNNVREWEPHWRPMLPVDDLFETVVDSAFVGLRKPEPEIYALTTSRMAATPQACVLIDDFEHNCQGARDLGWHAVRFADTDQTLSDLRALLASHGAHG